MSPKKSRDNDLKRQCATKPKKPFHITCTNDTTDATLLTLERYANKRALKHFKKGLSQTNTEWCHNLDELRMASWPNQLDKQRGVRDLSPSRCLSLPFEETAEKMFIVLRSWSASVTPCPTTSTRVGAAWTVLIWLRAKWGTLRETGADCFGLSLFEYRRGKLFHWTSKKQDECIRTKIKLSNHDKVTKIYRLRMRRKFSKYVCPLHEVTLTRHKLRRTKSSSYWVPQCHELRIQMWFIVCALPCSARPTSLGERCGFRETRKLKFPTLQISGSQSHV